MTEPCITASSIYGQNRWKSRVDF